MVNIESDDDRNDSNPHIVQVRGRCVTGSGIPHVIHLYEAVPGVPQKHLNSRLLCVQWDIYFPYFCYPAASNEGRSPVVMPVRTPDTE